MGNANRSYNIIRHIHYPPKGSMSPRTHRLAPRIFAFLLAVALTTGCSSPISKSVRNEIDSDISFLQLREQPASYEGRTVLLGGEIIRTHNEQQGTTIEILQKELDRWGCPKGEDETGGRFRVFTDHFLDPVVYSQGRRVTIAGTVAGGQVEKIGEVDYVYPLLLAREIHLWQDRPDSVIMYPYPVWYHWDLNH